MQPHDSQREQMPRRTRADEPEKIRQKLASLLRTLSDKSGPVADQVGTLVQMHHCLRDLGASIAARLAPNSSGSARARLLAYFQLQVGKIVHTDELMIIGGIGDYPRRIRELRTQHGWPIISGLSVRDIRGAAGSGHVPTTAMSPEEYILIEDVQDSDAVRRWANAGRIREAAQGIKEAILTYMLASPRCRITAEELRYVAGNDGSWPTALELLRKEGWQIDSYENSADDVPFGLYVLTSTDRA